MENNVKNQVLKLAVIRETIKGKLGNNYHEIIEPYMEILVRVQNANNKGIFKALETIKNTEIINIIAKNAERDDTIEIDKKKTYDIMLFSCLALVIKELNYS